ncbi:MAG: hypothetical protein WAW73_22895 [Rhodoferax sp.]
MDRLAYREEVRASGEAGALFLKLNQFSLQANHEQTAQVTG